MKSRLTYLLIWLTLRLNGWRPVYNTQGVPAWEKRLERTKTTLIGDWRYALTNIQR